MASPLGSPSNLAITLGLFLKLLGFFVVMFSYADFVPSKVDQVELSLQQRFNISLPFPEEKSGHDTMSLSAVQGEGYAFDAIETDLKAQMDLLSTKRQARSGELILRLPAEQVLSIGNSEAKSPHFDRYLVTTLERNVPKQRLYDVDIIATGGQPDAMMRALGNFVQNMIARQYPQELMTIGYERGNAGNSFVEFRIRAVPK